MGMFGDAGQAVDSFFDNLFTSEPQEWELLGYESYDDWWKASEPDIKMYQSPIFPGGFDEESYKRDYYDWMSKRPNQSFSQ